MDIKTGKHSKNGTTTTSRTTIKPERHPYSTLQNEFQLVLRRRKQDKSEILRTGQENQSQYILSTL